MAVADRGRPAARRPRRSRTRTRPGRASFSCTKHCSSVGRSTPANPGAGRIVSPKSVPAHASSSTTAAPKHVRRVLAQLLRCARTPSVYAGALTAHATPAVAPTTIIAASDDHSVTRAGREVSTFQPRAGSSTNRFVSHASTKQSSEQGDAVVDRQTPERHRRRDDDERPVPEVQRVRDVADELRGAQREEARRVPPALGVRCGDHGGGARAWGAPPCSRGTASARRSGRSRAPAPRCRPSRARSCRWRCGSAARG